MTYNPVEFKRILKNNGYREVAGRGKGSHTIYSNGNRTLSLSKSCNKMIMRRLIKEYGLMA